MPGLLIASIVLGVIVLLLLTGRLVVHKPDANDTSSSAQEERAFRTGLAVVAGIGSVIIVLLLLFASLAFVGTKDIGVKTAFGKPVGSLSNGIHFKAPWEKVTTIDDAVQIENYTAGPNDDGDCITVRIARQATACVDTSIKWQIKQSAGDALFRNYRNFDKIRDSLVKRNLQQAVNAHFGNYDPLGIDTNGDSTQVSLTDLSTAVQKQMATEIGDQIDVISVIIPVLHFDGDTQNRINSLQAQVAQTRIAQQAEKTAAAQAAANQALAASVSNAPGVLESKCLDLLQEALNKGQQIQPLAFQCFGSSNGSGAVVTVK